jgi:hypothetical protein
MSAATQRSYAPLKAARRSPAERQAEIRANDTEMATRLWQYAVASQDMDAARLAIKMFFSVSPENQFDAEGFQNEGELYATSGQVLVPPTRLSQAYLRRQGASRRRKMMRMLSEYRLLVGYSFRFYTLTMPDFGVDYELTLDIIEDALHRLKRSRIWRDNVRGAYDKVEWTTGKQITPHNHVHAHVLAAARLVSLTGFTATWTRCVRASAEARSVAWQLPEGRTLSVKLETRTTAEMIAEMTKYIAKPSDYKRLDGAELFKIHSVLRNRRLLNSYGDFNANKGKVSEASTVEVEDAVQLMPSLDTGTQLNTSNTQDECLQAADSDSEQVVVEADFGTQLNTSAVARLSLEELRGGTKEEWSVEKLEEWRLDYAKRFNKARERRLLWLRQRHRRCKIVLGDGSIQRGVARLELVEQLAA